MIGVPGWPIPFDNRWKDSGANNLRHLIDCPNILNLNGFELFILDEEILAFGDFVAPGRVLPRDDIAGFGIHILLLQ
jgi:hypothetical protein